MLSIFRRRLFWQVYPTLLISLALVAILGAAARHFLGGESFEGHMPPRLHPRWEVHLHGLGMLGMIALIVAIGAYPVMARITRRLESLRTSVAAWGEGDLTRRATIDGDDEIAAVAASFNHAADRTDALLAAHKSLLAHASHELRSPLARLSLAAEMLSGDQAPSLARTIRTEIDELDALVAEILLASRLDHGTDTGPQERVDCLALAAEEASRAAIHVADVPPNAAPFIIWGDPALLRRMIRNLIENALKHGSRPVEIALGHAILKGQSAISISVSDAGPAIAPALRDRIFEPFFRPGSASEATGSWGLGLSLVKQIAERHQGSAICAASAGGTTVFVVELPAGH